MESKIHEILAPLVKIPVIRLAGDILNRLGEGDALAFIAILILIWGTCRGKARDIKIGTIGILTVAVSGIGVQILKHLFGRARPAMHFGEYHFIGPNFAANGFDSFPSGHAMSSFALATYLSMFYPSLSRQLYVTAGIISILGRVAFGHHYLTDVIVGGILGFLAGEWIAKRFSPWIEETEPKILPAMQPPEPETTAPIWVDLLIVAAFSALALLPGISVSALWDRDETEYAQAVIEMKDQGKWLVPTLEGRPFLEKPILLYWITRASYKLFGVNEFSARFPSAGFGILTCLATYVLGFLFFGRRAGLFSAGILASTFLFAGGFRLLMTDPSFVFFTLLSFVFYTLSEKDEKRKNLFFFLGYVSIGLGILAKGPIALYPFCIFLIHERLTEEKSWEDFLKTNVLRHALYLAPALGLAAPWFLYSFKVQAGAATTFFLYDNLSRFFKAAEGHSGPFFYYILVLLAGFFPWSFFLSAAFIREWKERRSKGKWDPKMLLLITWALFLFLFFSFCSTKLPHYMIPVLPPLALLTGKFWSELSLEDSISMRRTSLITLFFTLLLALAPDGLFWVRREYFSIRLSIPFMIFAAALFVSHEGIEKSLWEKSFKTIAAGALALFISISHLALPWVEKFRVMKPAALELKKNIKADSKVYGYFISEPSLFIYGGRLFPLIENGTLDDLFKTGRSVFIFVKESTLKDTVVRTPYKILARKKGFLENGGETTLLLIAKDAR